MKKFTLAFVGSICCLAVAAAVGLQFLQDKPKQKEEMYVSGTMPIKTESELILDSDLIVEGSVAEILDSKWSNEDFKKGEDIRNILQTDIVVTVDRVLSGELNGDRVIVRIDKGEDENTVVYSDGYPDFIAGERVLLFLARDDGDVATDEDYYVLTGMRQGKYILPADAAQALSEPPATYVNMDKETNEEKTIDVSNLEQKIIEEKNANPNYKEEKAIRQEQIIEENKKLFGE